MIMDNRRVKMTEDWKDKNYSFFTNTKCEYFPCHKTEHPEEFNCLFCYCPLYALGPDCGGNYVYTEDGVKNCTHCGIPHKKDNYGYIIGKFQEIVDAMKKSGKQ